jgi:hypothetical protein
VTLVGGGVAFAEPDGDQHRQGGGE